MRLLCLSMLGCTFPALLIGQQISRPRPDWPQWRGAKRDAVSTETGLLRDWPTGGPPLVWNAKQANGGKSVGTGWSSVSIAGGKLFTMGDHGRDCFVFCLAESTGKQLWATRIGAGGGDGPRCTPTVDGDRVYALGKSGELACLGVEKGDLRWRKDYKADFGGRYMASWHFCESPLIDGDKLVCTPGADSAALVALNKYTGEVIWKAAISNTGGCGYSSIVVTEVGGIRQYVTLLGRSRGLVGVDAQGGKFLWSYPRIANGTANIPTAIVRDDLIFTSTGYGTGAALLQLIPTGSGIQVKERYFLKGNVLQNHHGGTVLVGDYLYGGHGHNDGLPVCLHLPTGKLAWGPVRGAGEKSAAVVYADGHLYFRYENNVLALVEATPAKYNLKSQFTLPGNLGTGWPHPVICNGRLYVRGRDQILCYDLGQH